jgi:hypothetical protein
MGKKLISKSKTVIFYLKCFEKTFNGQLSTYVDEWK